MKKITKILILTTLAFTISCNQSSDNFDTGEVANYQYKNEYFGLNITFNDNWTVQGENENKELVFDCTELIANGVESVKVNIENEMKDNAVLLNLRNINDTSSIVVFAERETGFFWRPTSMETYLLQVKSLLDNTSLDYEYLNETESELSKWNLLETKFQLNDKTVYQNFFVSKKSGYFITLISSFQNEEQKQQNKQLIDNVKF
jgi:hypothetical protein